jgi:hypothetical protein
MKLQKCCGARCCDLICKELFECGSLILAVDKKKDVYKVHPMTGHPIEGFRLPDWEQALEMVAKAASKIPEMAYIGWDVAFSENGPLIIEGNNFPGHDIYQLPAHTPDGFGVYPQFQV